VVSLNLAHPVVTMDKYSIHSTEYDTIRNERITWTKMVNDQLNVANVARKKLKQTSVSAHLVQYCGSRFVEAVRHPGTNKNLE